MKHGADTTLEAGWSWSKHTSICASKPCGYDKALELMLSKGVSGNSRFRFSNGSTSPHLAIDTGNPLVMKAHLEGSVDVNSLDDSGEAPLHGAAQRGPKGIIEMLLNHGARIDAKDFE